MAIPIKGTPTLKGKSAERFNQIIAKTNVNSKTEIPLELRNSINKMLERSKYTKIKGNYTPLDPAK